MDIWGYMAVLTVSSFAVFIVVSTLITCARQRRDVRDATMPRIPGPEEMLGVGGGQRLLASPGASNGGAASPGPARNSRQLPLFVQAFSLVGTNGTLPKLFDCPPYKPTDSLNGIRVLSMVWIILGHTFLMPEGISGYANGEDIFVTPGFSSHAAEQNPLFMLIVAAEQGVDTFFFLSGFLLSLLTLRELPAKNGKLNPLQALVLRYIRLTPSLAFVMLVFYKILAFLGNGPFAAAFQDSINRRCDISWWSELTYTMNFVPFDSDKICMGWTWYLGDDMIFFIFGILLLPVFYKRRWLGWMILVLLIVMSMGISTWLVYKYHLGVYAFGPTYTRYSYYAYSKPYTRIPAYLVGIATAWLLDELERRGLTRATSLSRHNVKFAMRVASLFATAMLLFLVFIPTSDYGSHKDSWADPVNSLFINSGRLLWSASWGMICISFYYDYLAYPNAFLSHWMWTPMTRLSYGAYLVHPLVIKLSAGNEVQFYTFSGMDLAYRAIGNSVLAYSASVLVWCFIERPMMTFTSALLKKKRSVPKEQLSVAQDPPLLSPRV